MPAKGTCSWRLVAILTCKSFVVLGYGAVVCFPQDSWTALSGKATYSQTSSGWDPVVTLVNPRHRWRWIVLLIVLRQCGDTNTYVRKLHDPTKTSQHATRDTTTQQQGWPWRLDNTRGSRQDIHSARVPGSPGRLWMARNHHDLKKTTAHSNMVAEQVWTYGLVETFVTVSVMTAPSCAWTVAALGPDESSQVDLVTGDLDVYVSSQNLELFEVRKSLEFAEIRRRL